MRVARPLPSEMTDEDEALPLIASLPPGMSVSKYFLNKGPEEFVSNIRNTENWPFVMSDPIFLEIKPDTELVSVVELISRRKKLFETHRIQEDEGADEESQLQLETFDGDPSNDAHSHQEVPLGGGDGTFEDVDPDALSDRSSRRSSIISDAADDREMSSPRSSYSQEGTDDLESSMVSQRTRSPSYKADSVDESFRDRKMDSNERRQ